MGDVLDAPRGRAEREDVTDAGLVDHLLVELADPGAALPGVAADEEHAEQAAVRDGAAAGDREPLRPRTGGELAGDAVPHQPRAQLGELVGGVATGEEVQHGVVRRARQAGERRGAADQVVEGVDVPRLHGGGGDELLGEDVEGVGGHPHRLDRTGAHPLDGDGGLGEVAAVLGEEHAAGDLADLVAGATDALQGAGDAGRGLDLDDEVDRAHVDAELEAAGGDHGGQATGPTPARSAAISLRRAVSRSERRRELAKTMVERWPSMRSATRSSTCGQRLLSRPPLSESPLPSGSSRSWTPPGLVMSSTGTTTESSHSLLEGGATISTGALPPRKRATSSSGRTVAERPMRWAGESSIASRRSRLSARWAPRLVPATACTSSMITVRTPRSDSRAWLVSMRNSDSGVVMRMSGGLVESRRRSAALVSPERTPTWTSLTLVSSRSAVWRMPVSGARRLRSTSTASALSGLT